MDTMPLQQVHTIPYPTNIISHRVCECSHTYVCVYISSKHEKSNLASTVTNNTGDRMIFLLMLWDSVGDITLNYPQGFLGNWSLWDDLGERGGKGGIERAQFVDAVDLTDITSFVFWCIVHKEIFWNQCSFILKLSDMRGNRFHWNVWLVKRSDKERTYW